MTYVHIIIIIIVHRSSAIASVIFTRYYIIIAHHYIITQARVIHDIPLSSFEVQRSIPKQSHHKINYNYSKDNSIQLYTNQVSAESMYLVGGLMILPYRDTLSIT